MTDLQFASCQQCLNRKKGVFEPADICNLRGNVLFKDAKCDYFTPDTSVVTHSLDKREAIKPNQQRAKYAALLVLMVTVLDLVSFFSSYNKLKVLHDLRDGIFVSDEVLDFTDSREQALGIVYIVLFIVSATLFILWFRRAYYNLHLRTAYCEHSDIWAFGSWFVPIISLFRPYQIMNEMWNKTAQLLQEKANNDKFKTKSDVIIMAWWSLWIIINYIGNYIIKAMFKEETIEMFIKATIAQMISAALAIPLGILTFKMIKEYAKMENDLQQLEKAEANPVAAIPSQEPPTNESE